MPVLMDIENSSGAIDIDMDSNGIEVDDMTMAEQDRLLGNFYHAHNGAFCNQPVTTATMGLLSTLVMTSPVTNQV
jgi:hypothetical protein